MTVLTPGNNNNSMAPNKYPFRKSMFGLKTPISKCRRRNNLEDFDGIRSILSYRYVIIYLPILME
jgi:hypothetical protein